MNIARASHGVLRGCATLPLIWACSAFATETAKPQRCIQREAWDAISPTTASVAAANGWVSNGIPAWSFDTYKGYSRSGQRIDADHMHSQRLRAVTDLTIAECLTWQKRYILTLSELLLSMAKQSTWVLAAHDRNLDIPRTGDYFIDLGAAEMAATLAVSSYLLRDQLPVEVIEQVHLSLRQRVLNPFLRSLQAPESNNRHWWLTGKSNWNAVCLAGVAVAAIYSDISPSERHAMLEGIAHYIAYFEKSFLDDGYATEGLAYWAYGMGRYLQLRELLLVHRPDASDLVSTQRQVNMLLFAQRFRLFDKRYPPYADSRRDAVPGRGLSNYVDAAIGRPVSEKQSTAPADTLASLVWSFFNRPTPFRLSTLINADETNDQRTWFSTAQVYVARPRKIDGLAASYKAAGSGNHSHNDLGSYVIAKNGQWISGDPGGPAFYDADSFSAKRFTQPLFNSYGHPVPVVDGQLQGDATRIKLTSQTEFSTGRDRILTDLAPAYITRGVKQVLRSFTYRRDSVTQVEITDELQADLAQAFEVPVITAVPMIEVEKNRRYRIESPIGPVTVDIEADFPLVSRVETFSQNGVSFARQGFAATHPIRQGRLTVRYSP